MEKSQQRPGDVILNRYMPNASEAEREDARSNLYALAAVFLRICTRIARERDEEAIRAQRASGVDSKGELRSIP